MHRLVSKDHKTVQDNDFPLVPQILPLFASFFGSFNKFERSLHKPSVIYKNKTETYKLELQNNLLQMDLLIPNFLPHSTSKTRFCFILFQVVPEHLDRLNLLDIPDLMKLPSN